MRGYKAELTGTTIFTTARIILSAIAKRHPLGKGIEIKMIQTQRDPYANTKLSDKE